MYHNNNSHYNINYITIFHTVLLCYHLRKLATLTTKLKQTNNLSKKRSLPRYEHFVQYTVAFCVGEWRKILETKPVSF